MMSAEVTTDRCSLVPLRVYGQQGRRPLLVLLRELEGDVRVVLRSVAVDLQTVPAPPGGGGGEAAGGGPGRPAQQRLPGQHVTTLEHDTRLTGALHITVNM